MGDRLGRYRYIGVLAACLAATFPLEVVIGARVWRSPGRLLSALVPVVAAFSVWDAAAVRLGYWAFDPGSVTGWRLPGALPVEEVSFFAVIPLCGLLTFEAVSRLMGASPAAGDQGR